MKNILACFFFLWLVSNNQLLNAYEIETHRELAQRATDPEVSSLDQTLKNDLNIPKGIEQKFLGREVRLWIREGAAREDEPFDRVLNHFHNPLQPWDQAGLRVSVLGVPVIAGDSSILWGQRSNQAPTLIATVPRVFQEGGTWSWQNTRERYLSVLTDPNETKREEAFAEVFRGLGQLTHLVQDATVPAHVRNDSHLIGFDSDWYEKWVEKTRKEDLPLFQSLFNFGPTRPTDSIFTATNNTQAPVPIARLIDNEVFLGFNFDVFAFNTIGAAEYTNGNFLSRGTLFRDFQLPRQSALDPGFFEPVGSKFRRYFSKVGEGEIISHFVTEGMLYESLAAEVGVPPAGGWNLDDRVHQDYASQLLPRAVGYSASLLDYFFRGKLDVDIVIDTDDPSMVQVVGTNASPDKLDGGDLSLYWDDADGIRSPLGALDLTNVTADSGQEFSSARFQLPDLPPGEEIDKFIAVYKGKLGDETPQGDFPGGVIGKVIGGVRVEQLFQDGIRWNLRTPKGVFALPILVQDVEDLQWGDDDNTLVGSRFGPDEPNLFYAYQINRPLGSLDIPLRSPETPLPDQPEGSQVVDIIQRPPISFPFGLNVGTNVQFSHTLQYQQYFLWATRTFTMQWIPAFPGDMRQGNYRRSEEQIDSTQASLLVDETRTLNLNYPIILDPGHILRVSGARPYVWDLWEISLTQDGRILALVRVLPASPGDPVSFPAMTLVMPNDDPNTAPQPVEVGQITSPFSYPTNAPLLWALIDVEGGDVVASTAPSNIQINHKTARTHLSSDPIDVATREFNREKFVGGGPLDGIFRNSIPRFFDSVSHKTNCTPEQMDQMVFEDLEIPRGRLELTINQYRPEISQLQFPSKFGEFQFVTLFPFTCDSALGILPSGFRVTAVTGPNIDIETELQNVIRTTPVSGPEQLGVFLVQRQPEGPSCCRDLHKLVNWIPEQNRAELRHQFGEIGGRSILSSSPDVALIQTFRRSPLFSFSFALVPFRGDLPTIESADEVFFSMILLDPAFLYNWFDFKFYTNEPSPRRTALPATLAPTSLRRDPRGRFHVVKIQ